MMKAKHSLWLKFGISILLSAASLALGLSLPDLWPDAGFVGGLILVGTGPMFAIRIAQWRTSLTSDEETGPILAYLPWLTTLAGLGILVVTFTTSAGLVG